MKSKHIRDADLISLLGYYAEAAAKHGEGTISGDHKSANQQYEIISSVYRELRSRGVEAQQVLLNLLGDDNPNVRLWAAAHALEFAPEKGEPVLIELSRSGGIFGLNANLTLNEWREGKLKFP